MRSRRRLFARGSAVLAVWAILVGGLASAPAAIAAEPAASATAERTVVVDPSGTVVASADDAAPTTDAGAPADPRRDDRARPGDAKKSAASLRAENKLATSGTASISGTVTDTAKAPLKGITVTLYQDFGDDGSSPAGDTTTNAAGAFTFAKLPAGRFTLRFTDEAGKHVGQWFGGAESLWGEPVWFAVAPGAKVTGKNARLALGSSIAGSVRGPDNVAVADAFVQLFMWNAEWADWEDVGGTSTDSHGAYRLTGLRAGKYTLYVQSAFGSDLQSEWWNDATSQKAATRIAVSAGKSITGLRTTLALGASLAGRVTTSTGAAVSASITIYQRVNGQWEYVDSPWVADDGTFRASGLSAGDYTFSVEPDPSSGLTVTWWGGGHREKDAKVITLADGAAKKGLNLVLTSGATLSGTVTGGGKALAGATVALYSASKTSADDSEWVAETTTGADGRYRLVGIRAGTYTLHYEPPTGTNLMGEWWKDAASAETATRVDIAKSGARTGFDATLSLGSKIEGVVRGDGGKAVAANVALYSVERSAEEGTVRQEIASFATRANGTFSFGGLAAGTYTLRTSVEKGTYATEWWDDRGSEYTAKTITLGTKKSVTGLVVTLARAAVLGGVVTDESGDPVASATVDVFVGTDREFLTQATTDGDGRWRVGGLRARTYTLHMQAPEGSGLVPQYWRGALEWEDASGVKLSSGQSRTDLDVELRLGGTISGAVTGPGDRAVAGVTVRALQWVDGGWSSATETTTDRAGRYVLVGLPGGRYTVEFAPDNDSELGAQWWKDASRHAEAATFEVAYGAKIAGIDARLITGATIGGTVTNAQGAPVAGVSVSVGVGNSRRWAQTDKKGVWRITQLDAGRYTLFFERPEGKNLVSEWWKNAATEAASTPIQVKAASRTLTFNASLDAGSTIIGKVTDAKGAGVSSVRVVYTPRPSSQPANENEVETRPDGTYRIDGLRAGSYDVEFRPSDDVNLVGEWWRDAVDRSAATAVVVGTKSTVKGIDASLAAGGALSGRVTDADGKPLAEAVVFVVNPDTRRWSDATTSRNGTWTIRSLPAGTYRVQYLAPYGVNAVGQWWKGATTIDAAATVTVADGKTVRGLDARLARGGTIRGVVTGPGGAPVADAEIAVSRGGEIIAWAQTNAGGSYVVTGLEDATYTLRVRPALGSDLAERWWKAKAPGAKPTTLKIAKANEIRDIDVALVPGAKITGTLRAASGTPLAGAYVEAYRQGDGDGERVAEASTDTAGSYTLPGLAAGTYAVKFTYEDGTDSRVVWWGRKPTAETARTITVTKAVAMPGHNATLPRGLDSGTLVLSGAPRVGSTLTAATASWPKGTHFLYRWWVGGDRVDTATGRTLKLTAAHRGSSVTLEVVAWGTGTSAVERMVWMDEPIR